MSKSRFELNDTFRQQAPKAGHFPSINIGEFETIELSNGLTIIVVENRKLPKVAFQLIVSHDPILEQSLSGVADMSGELMSRGTRSRTKNQIDEQVDFIGGNLQTSSSGIYGSVLKNYQDEFFEIFLDLLLNPVFPATEFEKIKKKYTSRLETVRNEPAEMAYNVCSKVVFGEGHPYSDIMTQETLGNITLEDCRAHYENYWRPNCSYLAVVGDISKEEVLNDIAPKMELWQTGDVPSHKYSQPLPPEQLTICVVDRPGAVQSELRLTYPLDLHPANMNRIPASIMNHILGGGAFSGYLMSNLREDKGFTYGVRSLLQIDHVCGEFRVSTSVGTEVTVAAAREVLNEMNRIRDEKVGSEHMLLAKNSMVGSFARSLENPQTLANRVLNMIRYDLPETFYHEFADRMSRVSAEEIQSMTHEYVKPSQCYVVVVADYKAIEEELKKEFPDAPIRFFDQFGRAISK